MRLWGHTESDTCPTLCDPIDGSPPGSAVHEIVQARTLECHFLLQWMKMERESEAAQSCPTLSNPEDCSLTIFVCFKCIKCFNKILLNVCFDLKTLILHIIKK